MGDGVLEQPPGLGKRVGAEDRADRRSDQLLQILGAVAQGVAQEMHGAALPWSAQHLRDRLLEAFVGVGDDQLHPGKAAADQAAEELSPERLGLGRAHV
jgi:hypothetical protein